MTATVTKTVAELKLFEIDWSAQLATGETINTSTWSTDKDGALLYSSPAPTIVGSKTRVWLSAGTVGQFYVVTNTIVTSNSGRTLQQSFLCQIVAANLLDG